MAGSRAVVACEPFQARVDVTGPASHPRSRRIRATRLSSVRKMTTFAELGLAPDILEAIHDVGYESPSPIQEQAIPPLLEGLDVIGQAQTGSGKTAAFGLPMLQYVDPSEHEVQGLVLTPTRELCIQVTQALRAYGARKGVDVVAVFGGAPIRSPAGAAARRRPRRGRHRRSRQGPDQPPLARAARVPLRRARRGRRDARPRLPGGRREDPRADAVQPPDGAVPRHDAAGDPAPRRPVPVRPGHDQGQERRRSRSTPSSSSRSRSRRATRPRRWSSVLEAERPDQALVFVRTKIRCDQLYRTLRDRGMNVKRAARRHDPGRPRRGDDLVQGRPPAAAGRDRRRRRAGSTSRASRTSSTSTSRPRRTSTCTGSAAPAASGAAAARSRSTSRASSGRSRRSRRHAGVKLVAVGQGRARRADAGQAAAAPALQAARRRQRRRPRRAS